MKNTIAFIGLGNRGYIYAGFAKENKNLEITALCDCNRNSLKATGESLGVPPEKCFSDAEDFFAQGKLADAVVIGTPDATHYEICMKALEIGYDILLEKPIAVTGEECDEIEKTARAAGRKVVVCHVLRYTEFYRRLKEIVMSGEIGSVVHISQSENVGFWHYTQSFVRGKWKNSDQSSPMILQKCCHDFDIINWLLDSACISLNSYGNQSFFNEEHAPEKSAKNCCDCAVRSSCLYDAISRSKEMPGAMNVPYGFDFSEEGIEAYLKDRSNDYGKCVFRSDNNVVDHQSVVMQFENGATATLNMHTFAEDTYRSTKIIGTKGEIIGRFGDSDGSTITVNVLTPFSEFSPKVYQIGKSDSGHGGGDRELFGNFCAYVFEGKKSVDITDLGVSVASHKMAFAAEKSRLNGGETIGIK